MSDISRRKALTVLATAPLAAALPRPLRPPLPPEIERATRAAEQALQDGTYEPRFFTPAEWRTVRVLADLVIPRDGRSGSATDAGVPEFIDFTVDDRPALQVPIRGGLRWLDTASRERSATAFADATPAEQAALLDRIAWPDRAAPEDRPGVAFFNRFRDLVASGFFSSRIGIDDLRYTGNTYVTEWNGCPDAALRHIGVRYEEG